MSLNYTSVQWNKQKKGYDKILWLGIAFMLICFIGFQFLFHPEITAETIIIRATAITAFLLLHIILSIGPLARLNTKFLPLLYNRRHLGVSMFFIALIHGVFSIIQFHALGDINAVVSVFTSNQHYQEISEFPFQTLGFFALLILFLMAATSHDFWLNNLSPKIWKTLHMGVYVVYGLLVLHVALGALQYEDHLVDWVFLLGGFIAILSLHLVTGIKENRRLQKDRDLLKKDGFYEVCLISDIPESCAKTIFLEGENIAIFKYDGRLSAVNNVCKHQMGPLGEGRIVDGCITCPWHGYQYKPEDGKAPPPFTEKLKTYQLKVLDGKVWVNPDPNEEGTYIEPVKLEDA